MIFKFMHRINWVIVLAVLVSVSSWASAAGVEAEGRPVADVKISGCKQTDPQLLLNQVRMKAGKPYDSKTVTEDIRNMTRLGRFSSIKADVKQNADGTVTLIYIVKEQPILADVQVVGNKHITDQELLSIVVLQGGDIRDEFMIKRGKNQVIKAYKKAGYFLANVDIDRETLDESNVLVYTVREGPQVKVRGVKFEGNKVFPAKYLSSQIGTKKYVLLFEKGELSEEKLDRDVASLLKFYNQRGYIDARVGRRIRTSDNQKDAEVVFLIEEGRQYIVGTLKMQGVVRFSENQIREALTLKKGAVFSSENVRKSTRAIESLYGRLGYLGKTETGKTRVSIQRVPHQDEPIIDLILVVREGKRYLVGDVKIRGNQLTQDKVIRRQLRGMEPGRYYDKPSMRLSERRIRESSLFTDARITLQGTADDDIRDALVEVKEGRTGSISFGAAISSDSGVIGAIDLQQRNFDIADWPESFKEFISGDAFRGAGQSFSLSLQPGDDVSNYSVRFRDPYLNDSEYFFDTTLFFRKRDYDDDEGSYDEERYGGRVGFGKRFGDVWSASVRLRYEKIDITGIDEDAPVDVFDVEGKSDLDAVGFDIIRNTTDSRIFPTRGSYTTFGIERFGVLGGDYEFSRLNVRWNKFWTVHEDFFGRRTTLAMRTQIGYIFESDEAPMFERFYAGGHRTFRGFRFRGVGPRGIRNDTGLIGDDPVGGDWMFLWGLEYNYPIFKNYIRGVVFTDTGTVQDDFGFDEYRVSVGAGIRLVIPFLGQAPFAFDLAYPIMKEEDDETRVFSFSIALPF